METTRSAAADDGCISSTKLHALAILVAEIRMISTAEPTHPQLQLNRLVILLLCRSFNNAGEFRNEFRNGIEVNKSISADEG